MKLMIASDIHGAAGYCRELLAAFDREGADRLLLLGDILYHGENVTGKSVNAAKYRSHVGMVFQSFNLFPQYTALENVMLAKELLA